MKSAALLVCLLAVLSGASARTYTSGGSCTAVASSHQESYARDACLKAIAVAVNKGCSAKRGNRLVETFTGVFYDSAVAIARVAVHAFAGCSTHGNAYGCAAGKAVAYKYADANIHLFAAAFAKALNHCHDCDPKAAAFIKAKLLVNIVAAAYAKAEAGVCVGPNQSAQAEAFEKCTAIVIARGFAEACARALIAGNCMSQTAIAEVKADLRVETHQYCKCHGWKWTNGGWAHARGGTDCYDYQG